MALSNPRDESMLTPVSSNLDFTETVMHRNMLLRTAPFAILTAVSIGLAFASDPTQQAAKPTPAAVVGGGQYSPYVGETFPNRVFWGVAHVHTGYSFDSGMFGVTLTPDDLFQGCHRRGSRPRQRGALQTGPAARLGLHH